MIYCCCTTITSMTYVVTDKKKGMPRLSSSRAMSIGMFYSVVAKNNANPNGRAAMENISIRKVQEERGESYTMTLLQHICMCDDTASPAPGAINRRGLKRRSCRTFSIFIRASLSFIQNWECGCWISSSSYLCRQKICKPGYFISILIHTLL